MSSPSTLNQFLKPLDIDPITLSKLAIGWCSTFKDLARHSDNQFLPSPVVASALSTRDFDSLVLAIDVGGSHLRVGLFGKGTDVPLDQVVGGEYEVIPEDVKAGTAEGLFSYIGEQIVHLLRQYKSQTQQASDSDAVGAARRKPLGAELAVGVTFSFPMIQQSISEAVLMPLGKGFTMKPGQKLDELLIAGYERHASSKESKHADMNGNHEGDVKYKNILPKLVIKAITNDTIATMIAGTQLTTSETPSSSHAHSEDPESETVMGLILATGMNASVPLRHGVLSDSKLRSITISAMDVNGSNHNTRILVNTEWSISGSSPPLHTLNIATRWDKDLDALTSAPGFQPLEYMTSGRYMGELVRIIFIDRLISHFNIERENIPLRLQEPWVMTTKYVSTVIAVAKSTRKLAEGELTQDFPPAENSKFTWTPSMAETLQTIAFKVQMRSSRLVAAACIGLLLCSGDIQLKSPNPHQPSSNTSTSINNKRTHDQIITPVSIMETQQPPSDKKRKEAKELTIAYSGAVIEKYPMYRETCQEAIDALFFSLCRCGELGGVERIMLRMVEEGGLRGAAVLAASRVGAKGEKSQ